MDGGHRDDRPAALVADRLLLLAPTELERRKLARCAARRGFSLPLRVCGFGPVSAAAGTAELLAREQPKAVCLVGIAGSFHAEPIGAAACFAAVRMADLGLPGESGLVSGAAAGFDPLAAAEFDRLHCPPPLLRLPRLLTVAIPSADPAAAQERFRHYDAPSGEDMEGYAVALACRRAGVPLTILRGFSNRVGARDPRSWRIDEALEAVVEALITAAWLPPSGGPGDP